MTLGNTNINNNSDYYSSDNDSDYDSDYDEDIFYEPEEISNTKYNIVLCELYNGLMHGRIKTEANNHYITICSFKKLNMKAITDMSNLYNTQIMSRRRQITPHHFVRNYYNMISLPNYIKPEIGENILLESGHCICIIKTLWLKIIQRRWKKIYKLRMNIIKKRTTIESLKYRRITGKWPENCLHMPSLRGMLNDLSCKIQS
jgi:hypothetical protein